MRVGEVAFVSPFRYTILIWAIVLGIVVFGDIPDGWTLLGATIVVATGIYTFYRERKLFRAVAQTAVQTAEGVSPGPRSARRSRQIGARGRGRRHPRNVHLPSTLLSYASRSMDGLL